MVICDNTINANGPHCALSQKKTAQSLLQTAISLSSASQARCTKLSYKLTTKLSYVLTVIRVDKLTGLFLIRMFVMAHTLTINGPGPDGQQSVSFSGCKAINPSRGFFKMYSMSHASNHSRSILGCRQLWVQPHNWHGGGVSHDPRRCG